MAKHIHDIMTASPVIPVIVITEPTHAVPLAQALFEGGLKVLEVTLRTPHGVHAIHDISRAVPDAIVGAGTITTSAQVDAAIDAGAQFLVSPGSTPRLIEHLLSRPVPALPGVATPSEAMHLLEYGIAHLKLFPAEASGGLAMLQSLAGPLPQITFCPTGGITAESAGAYLGLANVACVGGSWMLPQGLVNAGDWDAITLLARAAAQLGG